MPASSDEVPKKLIALLILGFLSLVILLNSFSCVESGHVRVVTQFDAVLDDNTLSEGANFIWFWRGTVDVNCQAQNESVGATWSDQKAAVSRDTQSLGFQLDIGWCVNKPAAPHLVRHYSASTETWSETIIIHCMWQAVKNVMSNYSVVEVTQQRETVKNEIEEQLVLLINERLVNKDPVLENAVTITQVNLSNIEYSDGYEQAIEAKQVLEQEVQREERELERIRINAQQQVAQAEAERDAMVQRANGEALSRIVRAEAEVKAYLWLLQVGVDPMTNRFYDTWDGVVPTVWGGGGGSIEMLIPASCGESGISAENLQLLLRSMQEEREAIEERMTQTQEDEANARETPNAEPREEEEETQTQPDEE